MEIPWSILQLGAHEEPEQRDSRLAAWIAAQTKK